MSIFKKPGEGGNGGKSPEKSTESAPRAGGSVSTAFEGLYPRLAWELLSRTFGDGKTAREPSGLSIFHQDGAVKACLRDRNYAKVCFRTGATVHEVLQALEEALAALTVDWREDKFARRS